MYSWLQEAIAENAVVVTSSKRLARELRAAYDEQQIVAGRQAWHTPSIRSWHDWLSRQSSAIENPNAIPIRLDAFSSELLMERSLRKHLPDGIPGVGGIVRQAVQSWQRVAEWQVPLAELDASAQSQDERAFALAAADYAQRLSEERWVDGAGMAELAANLITKKQVPAPDKLILAGFHRRSPAVRSVLKALEDIGCVVTTAMTRNKKSASSVLPFDNTESELRAAGAWARARLIDDPMARIAIVSPTLESNAPAITRLIREGLVPGWQFGGAAFEAAANVSYGRKLAEYPAIAIALLLLRWACQGLTSRELSLLLRSRCIAGPKIDGRSRIELALRRLPDRAWQVDEFLRVFRGCDDSPDAIIFLDCVSELEKISGPQHELVSPAEWAKRIDAALTAAQWPGDASLNSGEFQLINRWRELLNEFARIEIVSPQIDLREASQRLNGLASGTLYQPESGRGLVQVLGTLEAAGMEFDSIWISGLDASQWPPASRPALFIANKLQRLYEMPDATPGDTLSFARQTLQRLSASANDCVLSWAKTRDDTELTASSLLDDFGDREKITVTDPGWFACCLVGRSHMENPGEDKAPPVSADEHVRGGAHTVQRQYVEPFGAFVHGRLGVRPPEPIATGLSPSVRGNIIHNALHNLLAGKPAQDEIRRWTDEELEQRIGSAIDSALAEHTIHADPVMRRIIGLERSRLRRLLHEFVAMESARPEFAVQDVEKKLDYEAFGIRLGLRIDRVDRMADGRLLVIDYKTGLSKNFLDRNGEPADLQLIVYANALGPDVGGLVLINVDSRVISYKGAGVEGGPWKALGEAEWTNALDSWRSLADDALHNIRAGDVRINLLHSASEGRPLNILSRKEEQKRVD